jgi:glyoxylase-like metal-dependent hydrolase (beta-lactamase superfamily II)
MIQIFALCGGYLELARESMIRDAPPSRWTVLLVRPDRDTRLVLTADACYTRENMDRDILPTIVWSEPEMSHSLRRLRELRDRQGARMVYGHDPEQWKAVPRAPAAFV